MKSFVMPHLPSMRNGKSRIRHAGQIVGAWILILATVTVLAADGDEEGHSKLTYGGGKEFQADLYDARLLGELPADGKEPYLVFAGRDCPHCDLNSNVYFRSPSDEPGTFQQSRYPGNYYVSESGKLVARVRMFIGRCIDSHDGAVWFTEKREKGPWYKLVSTFYVNGNQLGVTEYIENLPKISVVRAAVSSGQCREILPLPKIYKTAAAYDSEHLQFRTDCSSPSPRDWPLGPGRAGKPLSYLDKQTDTLLYLEGDGRHLAAISPAGKVLWLRNPFVDADLCPYRNERPIIVSIGPVDGVGREGRIAEKWKRKSHLVEIRFDSSQFGVVDIKNGDFLFNGQN